MQIMGTSSAVTDEIRTSPVPVQIRHGCSSQIWTFPTTKNINFVFYILLQEIMFLKSQLFVEFPFIWQTNLKFVDHRKSIFLIKISILPSLGFCRLEWQHHSQPPTPPKPR